MDTLKAWGLFVGIIAGTALVAAEIDFEYLLILVALAAWIKYDVIPYIFGDQP